INMEKQGNKQQMNKFDEAHGVIKRAVQGGLNVLVEGPHGVGKSKLVLGVAAELKLRLAYLSASTLDPYVDLVGIPVPVIHQGVPQRIDYVQLETLTEAQIIFFDELNRAPAKVLNALFELVQFRSINGVKLPHLRCVIAAINPS